MLNVLKRVRDRFFGDGDDKNSVAVPVFDGALKPNNILEEADVILEKPGLDDLVTGDDGVLYASCANEILEIGANGEPHPVARFDQPIQALAAFARGFAVATEGGIVFQGGAADGKKLEQVEGEPLKCVTALREGEQGKLLISEGSRQFGYDQWRHDLLSHGASGRVIEYDPSSGAVRVLASGLEYCYGVCPDGNRIVASESWRHRVVAIADNQCEGILTALPGYPGRISPASGGGFWLSAFAARTQLMEFVLREDDFRQEMMRTIEPRFWVAPALSSGDDFREPLQIGGVRQMGILKPWAPPRSYGLVIRLDKNLFPLYSLHSRVGGRHHGVVSTTEHDGHLMVLSKGASRILRVPLTEMNLQE
ncbi:hypothetical protein [Mangrovitalea sediminis]|uniref:hypothetical protein n=1 Tax=Mangrovitalea sediminis TaxID=1982043 RepID=UPI000BE519A9|nr:hypothetical protein [Mangrovitalea sediminis]